MRVLSLTDDISAVEPITPAIAKAHLRVDGPDEDALITSLATMAREFFEEETERALVETTWTLQLDRFPRSRHEPIRIPRPPLRSITSITYRDTAGATQTWDASKYEVVTPAGTLPRQGEVYPAVDETYPDTRSGSGAVTITFEAGYADGAVPELIQRTLLVILGDLYENREGQVAGTIMVENKTLRRLIHRCRLPVMA